MRRAVSSGLKAGAMALALAAVLTPVPAAAQQRISFSFGGFVPRGLDGRDREDVLVNDQSFLDFNMSDLHGIKFGGEWLVPLGDLFDAAGGIEFYQSTTLAADRFSEFENTGNPIFADLKLRTIPINATFRFLPLGRHGVEPYVGGGVSIIRYRYSETGDFVADDNVTIINGDFVGDGWKTGPVILGGVRVPVGGWSIGGEMKYQWAVADLPLGQGFATAPGSSTPKIDLGGFSYAVTFGFKF
jgi:hypothetical protein